MTCQHTMTLGVYLLGALEPAERFAFESHLSYCEICRGELVRLAPLPGLLNQITPEDFADNMPSTEVESFGPTTTRVQPIIEARIPVQHTPPQVPLPPVADVPPRNRPRNKPKDNRPRSTSAPKRFWRVTAAAAAVVVLAVGAIFGWQTLRHEEPAAQPPLPGVVWKGTSADGTVTVEARMIDHEWGTEIQSKIHGLPPGKKCYLFVWDHYGYKEQAGWWGTDHDPNEEIPGSTSIMRSKIERLELKLNRETVVLTVWPPA